METIEPLKPFKLSKQDILLALRHYPLLSLAVPMAGMLSPAWRLVGDKRPVSFYEAVDFARRYDEAHPREEGSHAFFFVSSEGAIGYCAEGLEFLCNWFFFPMEPGPERDALVKQTNEIYEKLEAAEKAAKEAPKAPAPAASQKRFCKFCGAPLKNPDAKFCPNCGEQL